MTINEFMNLNPKHPLTDILEAMQPHTPKANGEGGIKFSKKLGKEKLAVLKRTIHNHFRRLTQLYEQKKHQPNWEMLLDDYRRRWVTWVYSGIPSSTIYFDRETNFLRLFLKATQS
jgi:hypothetical protein